MEPAPPIRDHAEVGTPGEAVDLTDVEPHTQLAGARFAGLRALGGSLAAVGLRDVVAREIAVAGVVLDGGAATRILVDGGRLSGGVWVNAEIRDVLLRDVRADGLTLRFCRLFRSRFEGCDLSGMDLTRSRLDHVEFVRCDLRGADVSDVTVVAARFTGCRFDGMIGAAGLAGAEIDAGDLGSLAPALAASIGIIVR
jgi:uncharacterized protein YjbI with pentapeptide repeats